MKRVIIIFSLLFLFFTIACEKGDNIGSGDIDTDTDTDTDTDADTDADTDTDTDTNINCGDINVNEPDGPAGSISGTVMAPSGTFVIPGALIFLNSTELSPPEIPSGAYCSTCINMACKTKGRTWTLSNSDGTWELKNVPSGTWNIITRKGEFQRQREITVVEGTNTNVPVETTTLPPKNSSDGNDKIPSYAVLLNDYDLSEDLLAKLGIGDLGSGGHLVKGTENFTMFKDEATPSGYEHSWNLFVPGGEYFIDNYHMVFFPCICGILSLDSTQIGHVQNWVKKGGKLYASCWASRWAEYPFPEYIEFSGSDTADPVGGVDTPNGQGYSTTATITNQGMRDWLSVVTPNENLDAYPFHGAYITIDSVSDIADGNGLDKDNGVVKPFSWVIDQDLYSGSPMSVTYDWGCGKIFYSVYQVVESSASAEIRPQEYVLLYLILEVGVCQGGYVIE